MRRLLTEFRQFILRGNVVDLEKGALPASPTSTSVNGNAGQVKSVPLPRAFRSAVRH
jgi:hypothetical protein